MMKKVLVLFAYPNGSLIKVPYAQYIERLNKYRMDQSYEFIRGSIKELQFSIRNNELGVYDPINRCDCEEYNALYFRFWRNYPQQSKALALFAAEHKIPFISREVLRVADNSKLTEYAALAQAGLPLIDSFCSSTRQIKKVFADKPPITYPLIVKSITGTLGANNHFVQNFAELAAVLDANPAATYIVQNFVPNDYDLRIIMLGGEPAVVLRRSRVSGHLNNTSRGGNGAIMKPSEVADSLLSHAVMAAKALGREDFCGVDVIVDSQTGQDYILEVNRTPQIETGAAIADKTTALNNYIATLTKE